MIVKVRRSKDFFTKDSPYKPKTYNKKTKKKLSKEYCRDKGRDIRVEEYYKDKDRGIRLDISI
jgi:hypothetical protein